MSKRSVPDCNPAINHEEISNLLSLLEEQLAAAYALLEGLQAWNFELISATSLHRTLKLVRQYVKQALGCLESPVLGIASAPSL